MFRMIGKLFGVLFRNVGHLGRETVAALSAEGIVKAFTNEGKETIKRRRESMPLRAALASELLKLGSGHWPKYEGRYRKAQEEGFGGRIEEALISFLVKDPAGRIVGFQVVREFLDEMEGVDDKVFWAKIDGILDSVGTDAVRQVGYYASKAWSNPQFAAARQKLDELVVKLEDGTLGEVAERLKQQRERDKSVIEDPNLSYFQKIRRLS